MLLGSSQSISTNVGSYSRVVFAISSLDTDVAPIMAPYLGHMRRLRCPSGVAAMRRCFASASRSASPCAAPVALGLRRPLSPSLFAPSFLAFVCPVGCDGGATVASVPVSAPPPSLGLSLKYAQLDPSVLAASVVPWLFRSCDCVNVAGCGGDLCWSIIFCSAAGGPAYAGVPAAAGGGLLLGVAAFSAVCVRMSAYRSVNAFTLCASSLNCTRAVVFACVSSSGFVVPAIAHAQTSSRFSVVVDTLNSIAAGSCRGGPAACAAGSWNRHAKSSSSVILPHARDARFAAGDEVLLWLSSDAHMLVPLVVAFAREPVTMPRAIASTPRNRTVSSVSAACSPISGTICTSTGAVAS